MKAQIRYSVFRYLFTLFSGITVTLQYAPAQWIVQDGHTPENLVDVIMLDSLKAIAIGDRNSILRTSDAGSTWINETIQLSAIFHWNAVSFSDTLNGTIVGDQTVWGTTDGGISWSVRNAPSQQKCLSVLQTSSGSMYIGADSGWMYLSNDTGKTWTSEKISEWQIRSIFRWRGSPMPGSPMYFALTPYLLYSLGEDLGAQWTVDSLNYYMMLIGSEAFAGEFCNDGEAGFIVGKFKAYVDHPAIVRKTGPGAEWQLHYLTSESRIFFGVSAPSANTVYACGEYGIVYKSTNSGDDWNKLSVPTTRTLNAIYFFNDTKGFAVGDSGTILYTSNGGGIVDAVDQFESLPLGFKLYQNYPNPFNPTTIIKYRIPNTGYVSLKVFDVLGKEVATLVNESKSPGTYSAQWNAVGLPSGVYFYRLAAGSYHETKKLILLR